MGAMARQKRSGDSVTFFTQAFSQVADLRGGGGEAMEQKNPHGITFKNDGLAIKLGIFHVLIAHKPRVPFV